MKIQAGKSSIGCGKTFIIAEAGINHNGDLDLARKLIRSAKDCGADAIKFQSFRADLICNKVLTEEKNVENLTGGTKSSYEMYKALELDDNAHHELFDFARHVGILCFTSIFDLEILDLLTELNTPLIKISSGDLNFVPLIRKAASLKIPLLVSTGLACFSEVVKCYELLLSCKVQFALLHCISDYPLKPEDANLSVIPAWKKIFDCPIGFSDHSFGTLLSESAVSLGADIIEKHFTLDHSLQGPDHLLSLDPVEFKLMVDHLRQIEKARGNPLKQPTSTEQKNRFNGRRGIKASKDLTAGTKISESDLIVIKPSSGLAPKYYFQIIGKTLIKDVGAGNPLNWSFFSPEET